MVNGLTERQRADDGRVKTAQRPIAAFDFDGTLTITDSFTAFLRWKAGPVRYALSILRLFPDLAVYLADRDRGRLKARAALICLGPISRSELAEAAEAFAAHAFDSLIRPDARRVWEEWRAKGAVLTIVTASPEEIIAPFARRLDAEVLLGSRLAFDGKDRLNGRLEGENCRAAEKVRKIKAFFGDSVHLAAAYGDTSGDVEMLAIADISGMKVFVDKPSPSPRRG